jgi:hypothetical protein
MPFRIDENIVTLDGHCSVEEAQPLFEALRGGDEPIFDLGGTRGLHTAIVQIVLASRGRLRAVPSDPTLAACFRDSPRA